jgi:hypothetical protein
MPRIFRRAKVVSIRLSNEEYGQLQNLCVARGTDSISELTRGALKMLANLEKNNGEKSNGEKSNGEKSNGQAGIESRVEMMDTRMRRLDREVARLSGLLGVGRLEGNHDEH